LAQSKRKQSAANEHTINHHRGLREGSLLILGAVGVYLLLCLITYRISDPSWSHSASQPGNINNAGGVAGALFADIFLYLFGLMAYLFPVMVVYSGWLLFQGRNLAEGFNTKQFWRKTNAKFINTNTSTFCGDKMPELMNENKDTEDGNK